MTLEELFAGRDLDIPAAQRRMAELMMHEGLPYGDRLKTFNSRLAQELAAWADSQTQGIEIHDALFRAYFVDGENIGVPENLVPLATQIGLSADDAGRILSTREFGEIVDADWARSRSLGITGVPTFLAGNRAVVGAQPYDVLENLVISAGAKKRSKE